MVAIVTKFHGPSACRGSRYSASAGEWRSVTVPDQFGPSATHEDKHRSVANMLAARYGWLDDGSRLVGGSLPDGSMCWVFVKEEAR